MGHNIPFILSTLNFSGDTGIYVYFDAFFAQFRFLTNFDITRTLRMCPEALHNWHFWLITKLRESML